MQNTITIKRKSGAQQQKLSLEEFIEFCGKNDITQYEVTNLVAEKISVFKSGETQLAEYKKSLNFAQINDIELRRKEVKFSKEIGYYLKTLEMAVEIHSSQVVLRKSKNFSGTDYFDCGKRYGKVRISMLPQTCHQFFAEDGTCLESFTLKLSVEFT